MAKYRKKPVVINAYQFTKDNFHRDKMPVWLKQAIDNGDITLWSQHGGEVIEGDIKTLEGVMKVSEDDFIIRGISGECYPCKPNIFKQTYELAEE
jgi:hypothetical protein